MARVRGKWFQPGARTVDNLYTGLDPTKQTKYSVLGAMGVGGVIYSHHNSFSQTRDEARSMDLQTLPGTRGDQTDYSYNGSILDNMQAQGDLVFALHKLRHGG